MYTQELPVKKSELRRSRFPVKPMYFNIAQINLGSSQHHTHRDVTCRVELTSEHVRRSKGDIRKAEPKFWVGLLWA